MLPMRSDRFHEPRTRRTMIMRDDRALRARADGIRGFDDAKTTNFEIGTKVEK